METTVRNFTTLCSCLRYVHKPCHLFPGVLGFMLRYEHKQLPWQGGVCCVSLSKLANSRGAPCAGSSLTPWGGVGSAGTCASWLLWAGLFCSSWGRAEIPTCAAWKTLNKGVEDGKSHKVIQASWKQGTNSWKKAFWQPAMFFIWPMTWHMEMFFTVFWNKKLLDYDFYFSRERWARFPISFPCLEERFATPACCVLTWFLFL